MVLRTSVLVAAAAALCACAPSRPLTTDAGCRIGPSGPGHPADSSAAALTAEPLVIGESFTIGSRILGEDRRVNVLVPTVYGEKIAAPMPVLYVLDGGIDEDFLHIAGLVQILVCNGGMRPFVVVGIQNTDRRRDMTGPTENEEDRKIAPVVGGSAAFRRFIAEELMPAVRARYHTTDEAAIVGESLAGLFVLETFFLEPDLFDLYIAVDPSLYWADEELITNAAARLAAGRADHKSVFVASSADAAALTAKLAAAFETQRSDGVTFHHATFHEEKHATVYHPAALVAFRTVLGEPVPTDRVPPDPAR